MRHKLKHPDYVDGCFGCKLTTINFGTVPGGAKDRRTHISELKQREDDLHRYREKRRAGEQPDGTTKAAMDRSERKQESWVVKEQDLIDYNPPEVVKKTKRALTNLED